MGRAKGFRWWGVTPRDGWMQRTPLAASKIAAILKPEFGSSPVPI